MTRQMIYKRKRKQNWIVWGSRHTLMGYMSEYQWYDEQLLAVPRAPGSTQGARVCLGVKSLSRQLCFCRHSRRANSCHQQQHTRGSARPLRCFSCIWDFFVFVFARSPLLWFYHVFRYPLCDIFTATHSTAGFPSIHFLSCKDPQLLSLVLSRRGGYVRYPRVPP